MARLTSGVLDDLVSETLRELGKARWRRVAQDIQRAVVHQQMLLLTGGVPLESMPEPDAVVTTEEQDDGRESAGPHP